MREGRQHDFLIAPAFSVVFGQCDRGFATGEKADRALWSFHFISNGSREIRKSNSQPTAFSMNVRGHEGNVIASLGFVPGGFQGEPIVTEDDVSDSGVGFLERFRQFARGAAFEVLAHAWRDTFLELVGLQDLDRVLVGRRIGSSGSGSNHIQAISNHVGDDERDNASFRGLDQPPALHARKMFSHRVHLVNGGAGREKKVGDRLLVGEGHVFNWCRP